MSLRLENVGDRGGCPVCGGSLWEREGAEGEEGGKCTGEKSGGEDEKAGGEGRGESGSRSRTDLAKASDFGVLAERVVRVRGDEGTRGGGTGGEDSVRMIVGNDGVSVCTKEADYYIHSCHLYLMRLSIAMEYTKPPTRFIR